MSSQKRCYKYCIVPQCTNTTVTTPNKVFVTMPIGEKVRKSWCNAMKRDQKKYAPFSNTSVRYCCEDHFDLESDMENYVQWKMMGCKIRLKKGVLPHIFHCQNPLEAKPERSAPATRCHLRVIKESLSLHKTQPLTSTDLDKMEWVDCGPTNIKNPVDLSETTLSPDINEAHTIDKQIQVKMEDHQTIAEVKEEMIDYEFVEVGSHNVHQLCTACLCATRTTHMLNDDTLKQYYMNILTETQMQGDVKVLLSPRLCWECVIHLKRSMRFREQVQDSYRLLQPMLLTCDKEYLDELLQSSVCRPGRLQTCFAHSVDIAPRDEELPAMTADHDDADVGVEQLLMQVKEEDDIETDAEASECPETNMKRRSSTPRETVATIIDCIKEGPDELPPMHDYQSHDIHVELLEETESRTREPVKRYVKTLNTAGFQCEVCHKSFLQKSHLIEHIRTHTGEKPYQCEVCRKSFAKKSNLITHSRAHTGEKYLQCEVCYISFANTSSLIRHRRAHTGEKPFQCTVCPKSFSQKTHLLDHLRTHTGDKSFQCEVCRKSYINRTSLKEHRRTHTGEKPYQCEVCPKSFARKSHLTRHRRTHTGDKPFQCDVCLKSFSQKTHLLDHLRTHTGDKPFQCKVCRKSFATKNRMKEHTRAHQSI